ncbi:MAG TPA: hypothetical protein PLV68_15340, partial [Ilumatobacteraceae bacterium]|nr:hypothetical protein [Ilumatobacteraceae bacterium]
DSSSAEAVVINAVGPDRLTFEELARAVATAIGKRRAFVHLPTALVIAAGRALGRVAGQELLTGDELRSTIDGLADVDGPATGQVSLTDWLTAHGQHLGRRLDG